VSDINTAVVEGSGKSLVVTLPRFTVRVVSGPDAGLKVESVEGRLLVGTAEGALLRLTDPTVSRYHLDFEATARGLLVRDLGSTNGTMLGNASVREIAVTREIELDVGRTRVRLEFESGKTSLRTQADPRFGQLIGESAAMKLVFASLEKAAPTSAPVLVTGESGTGKELAARAIHEASPRAAGPFEIVQCGGLPATLIESELFGHERGAFPGATDEQEGAYERADGGTLFLDEVGELPLELQPKLLRALGGGEIRRVGGKRTRVVDVRIVASTNRDLRRHVNSGQFRADLYYRLAVIQVHMPPLRERLEDLPLLVRTLLDAVAEDRGLDVHIEPDANLIETLARHGWPGNVRELRNYLEQLVILRTSPALSEGHAEPQNQGPSPSQGAAIWGAPFIAELPANLLDAFLALEKLPLRRAKAHLLERFERHYVTRLLETTGGNVAEAARHAGVDRVTLFRTIRRYGLRSQGP
jgi:two-component system response regulator GlrR